MKKTPKRPCDVSQLAKMMIDMATGENALPESVQLTSDGHKAYLKLLKVPLAKTSFGRLGT